MNKIMTNKDKETARLVSRLRDAIKPSSLQDKLQKAQFVGLTYRSKSTGELARYTVQAHVSYLNALQKSLLECRLLDLSDIDGEGLPMRDAKAKVLKSLRKSIRAQKAGKQSEDYTKRGVYRHDGKGVTTHKGDGSIEIHGLVRSKVTIEAGHRKATKSRPLTIAKRKIERELTKGAWRTFAFENVEAARLAGIEFH